MPRGETKLHVIAVQAGSVLCILIPVFWLYATSIALAEISGETDVFLPGAVHDIKLEIRSEDVERLARDPRIFVAAAVTGDRRVYSEVGVHLKGATGSFRPITDKPSFTLDFSRFNPGQRFQGLRRIHLNNSLEDPSCLNEALGSELFIAAGVPAPRVSHARVMLNGRSLGFYVLKEGFTEDFLRLHFRQISGDLYEPEPGQDIDGKVKRNSVQATTQGRQALKTLAAAATEADPGQRWLRLESILDLDRCLTFMALEVMLAHRDGYCLARNNFRVYHDLDSGKLVFLPQGMDQLFSPADLPWRPHMAGLVARAVLSTPQGRRRYSERFQVLFTNVFRLEAVTRRVDELVAELQPLLREAEVNELRAEANTLQLRISQRHRSLEKQLAEPEVESLVLENRVGRLRRWTMGDKPSIGKMEQGQSPDGIAALHVVAGADTFATWKTTVRLKAGKYRFEGRARLAGVKPLPYGQHQGAGLRVGGMARTSNDFTGNSAWRTLAALFQVQTDGAEVTLICELRASAGEVWFDLNSLQVVKTE